MSKIWILMRNSSVELQVQGVEAIEISRMMGNQLADNALLHCNVSATGVTHGPRVPSQSGFLGAAIRVNDIAAVWEEADE